MTKAERLHFLDNIVADVVRLDALLQRLRDLAQAESSVAEGSSSVADTIYSLRERFPALNISSRGDTDISIALPPEAAGIAFANLAENALQHCATLLELRVSADARTAVILVRDDGTGISEANRQRIFQPFFSTRREQGGTGMGLGIRPRHAELPWRYDPPAADDRRRCRVRNHHPGTELTFQRLMEHCAERRSPEQGNVFKRVDQFPGSIAVSAACAMTSAMRFDSAGSDAARARVTPPLSMASSKIAWSSRRLSD